MDDVQQVLQEDLSSYQTIVIDTIGKMMDYIISYKCGTRQPQIRDWGGINQEFSGFVRNLSNLNKTSSSLPTVIHGKKVTIQYSFRLCARNPTTQLLPNLTYWATWKPRTRMAELSVQSLLTRPTEMTGRTPVTCQV